MDMYNTKLRSLTYTLNNKYGNAKFIWINTLGIISPNNLQGLGNLTYLFTPKFMFSAKELVKKGCKHN